MLRTIACIISTAVLSVIAYPQIEWAPLAWVAFVPLLLAIDGKSLKAAFGWSYFCGFLFFAGTFGWFIYVTWPGAVLLVSYLSLYFAVFGLAFRFFRPLPLLTRLFIVPAVWVALEFLRAHLLSGFSWAMLAHSQYKNIALIQVADITGAYGVSFLVMLVNVLVFETIQYVIPAKAGIQKNGPPTCRSQAFGGDIVRAQAAVAVILALVLGYGFWRIATAPAWPTVGVGVVQPDIPQEIKWEERLQPWIVQKTIDLSKHLQPFDPELIVWPETSLPGIVSEVPELFGAIKLAAVQLHTPVLVGAITNEQGRYYNSVYLISAKGEEAARYDKLHLVPFGEYLPLRPVLGWVNRFVPLEDFTAGTRYTIFHLGPSKTFGVLICFEDTLGYLRRNFTGAGAGFMVNMTNDAWFMDTKAPFLHMQAAAFGCVETKRSLVRAANTGFSGFIDPLGRILACVQDGHHKKTFVAGTAFARVPIAQESTFYTKYGDVFTGLCLSAILWAMFRRRKYA